MKKKILLIVTTYNQLHYTKLCLENLPTEDNYEIHPLIIDDCSDDYTIEWCKSNKIEHISKDKPEGLTDSFNKGFRYFKKNTQYDYVVFSNNDVLIPKGSLTEMADVLGRWPFTIVCPMSTKKGVGHQPIQYVGNHYNDDNLQSWDYNNYQTIQDSILNFKKSLKEAKELHQVDPFRMKFFNGFTFMASRSLCQYEREDGGIFDPQNILVKNEDTFNWRVLLPNDDYPALCKTSFIYHFKAVSTSGQLDDFKNAVKDMDSFLEEREKISKKYKQGEINETN